MHLQGDHYHAGHWGHKSCLDFMDNENMITCVTAHHLGGEKLWEGSWKCHRDASHINGLFCVVNHVLCFVLLWLGSGHLTSLEQV